MADETISSPPSADGEASQATDDNAHEASPSSPASTRSILGMGVVSALNVTCLLFFAYHFTTHDDEPAIAAPLELRSGNVSFEPVSGQLLTIASHVEQARLNNGETTVEKIVAARSTPPILAQSNGSTETTELAVHWVQLGALSKIATARSYWHKLLRDHNDLLSLYKPSFVGPDQVGGSLYHVRVGPLPAAEAATLCSDLQQTGADCFCASADGIATNPMTTNAANAWPAPS